MLILRLSACGSEDTGPDALSRWIWGRRAYACPDFFQSCQRSRKRDQQKFHTAFVNFTILGDSKNAEDEAPVLTGLIDKKALQFEVLTTQSAFVLSDCQSVNSG